MASAPRIGLFWKVFGSYVGLVLASTLLVGLFATAPAGEESAQEADRFLRSKLGLLESYFRLSVRTETTDQLASDLRALSDDPSTRYTIIAPDGTVLADSEESPRDMENHAQRPELLGAREHTTGSAQRFSTTLRMNMMYVARRIDGEAGMLGYVRVALPARDIDALSKRLRSSILGASLLAIAIGLLLAWVFARRFIVPVRSLTQAAAAIAAGEYERRVELRSKDELGELADAFNSMSDQLRDRIATISRERRELRAILAGMVEGVVAVDAQGHVVLMNASACDMLDVPLESSTGKPLWEGVPLRPVAEVIWQTLEHQQIETSEVRLAGTAHDRVLELHAAPLRSAGGRAGAVLVMHDITELRRLELVRRDFVANASHELKTPVAAIQGLVETILDDDAMEPQIQIGFLDRIKRQARRLSGLIQEMLELSKLESAESAARRERLDVCEVVRGALDTVTPLADERDIDIRAALPKAPAVVLGTGEALGRIVVNLLDNAVKFTPESGAVDVRVTIQDGQVVLEVEDEGPGIPTAERDRIFERFYRIDRGRSRDAGGTGLGLAIVKHLAHSLGGDVDVAPAADQGSVFRVRIPAV